MKRLLPLAILLATLCNAAAGKTFLWIEGEHPSACNVAPNTSGWGNTQFLSGAQWLSLSIPKEKIASDVPDGGVLIRYDFDAPMSATYELWNRIGFEFARSTFEWRLDGGAWTEVASTELTTDLMRIEHWCEVAWLKLGDVALNGGSHTLEIRLPKRKNDKGAPQRILYACDAICLTKGAFHPNSKFKPGESGAGGEDARAAAHRFVLPESQEVGSRSHVRLDGLWEICRHDEPLPGKTDVPIGELPEHPVWRAIAVPGDKNTLRPDLEFAHRVWYRTQVVVPESCDGRAFTIEFPQNNLNTTVYVNGVYCGFNKNPFARFSIDVSKGMRPGTNKILVGIRDAWYGYSTNPDDPLKLRRKFNLPRTYFSEGFQDLAYPIWNHPQSGILVTPTLACVGSVYLSDVFCKPSVANQRLDLEVTLKNTLDQPAKATIVCEVVHQGTGQVAKTFAPVAIALDAGTEQVVALGEAWADAKLWWPDAPTLYTLRATVRVDGRVRDISHTTFGFREWTIEGKDFRLNGITWHGWADCFRAANKDEWLDFYHSSNQRMMRFWGTSWQAMPPEEALDFFDRSGVVVRRSGLLDGQRIGHNAVEHDPDLKKLYGSEVKIDLLRNWEDQMVAQVRGERNHPSVMIWSLENEYLYINCINLHGGLMDAFEAEVTRVSDAVQAADPTRPTMVDGGGACKANTLPVQGDHYVFEGRGAYPDLAYDANTTGGGRGRWQWDQQRPRFIGEDYFANGINPFDYAYFGGEETFQGKAQTRRAAGIVFRMLTEGYRWAEYGAWHFWMDQNEAQDQYVSNAPVAVFCREWDWTFAAEQEVTRTLRVFNDSRFDDPITFWWQWDCGGQRIAKGKQRLNVVAGASHTFSVTLTMPPTDSRLEGKLQLALTRGGKTLFRDTKNVSVLGRSLTADVAMQIATLSKADVLVHDPNETVTPFLLQAGIPFTVCDAIATLPNAGRLLIVGANAISSTECDSSKFQAYAAAGRAVIVLEQENLLKYQALPAAMTPAENEGRTAFIESQEHPIFMGLAQKDFFTWPGDHVVYRNAYAKPTRGGTSLIQCDRRLGNSAMTEIPCGKGLLLVTQLTLGEKLATSATAQRLLGNMIGYAVAYRQEFKPVVVCTRDIDPNLAGSLRDIQLKYDEIDDPIAAITDPQGMILVLTASPRNLETLMANGPTIDRFFARGGQLFLHGLTPDGLDRYNRLVGFDHMIRPFACERVTFPPQRNALTAGLTTGDIVMLSGERIFGWTKDEFLASDVFTYIVDYDDVAPFAQFSNQFSRNMVNGMVSADAWKYIVNLPAPDNPPLDWTLRFPKEQELIETTWIGNTFYYPVTKFEIFFDGAASRAASFATKPINDAQIFAIDPPLKGRNLTLRLAEWTKLPDKRQVTGLDNIALRAKRSDAFYETVRPLVSIGGLMEYRKGPGRIVLCNLRFQATEAVPENGKKKRAILAALLRNMKAPFAEGKTVIAGMPMRYEPIDIAAKCTQYRDGTGWFGDRAFSFNHMPTGVRTFAGVPFNLFDFPTSPVPNVIMLKGDRVPGNLPEAVTDIPIGRKADALFFLHTARMDSRRNARDIRDNKEYEMLRYDVHYADGQTVAIPILAEIDIDAYRQTLPRTIPGAQLAWIGPYAGTEFSGVAYMKQWDNPRPNVRIVSVAMRYGKERRGVPALLALTAANAE